MIASASAGAIFFYISGSEKWRKARAAKNPAPEHFFYLSIIYYFFM